MRFINTEVTADLPIKYSTNGLSQNTTFSQ